MRAQITIESGDGAPETCDLDPCQPITLGRNRSNTVILHDRHSSRMHAEIYCEEGHWFLRDCDTLNGTRLNGQRIRNPAALTNGDIIRIGDTCVRVNLDTAEAGTAPEMPSLTVPEGLPVPATAAADRDKTTLLQDELTAICSFMAACVEETSPRKVIERALTRIHSQTRATITGFLSLDPDNPMPKIVLPELASVDVHLSRQLTQQVQRTGRMVWLSESSEDGARSDSLLVFKDALCMPLHAGDMPLGALHVYKSGRPFNERDVRFCEVLAGFLAKSLHVLGVRRKLEAENSRLRVHVPGEDRLIGDSPVMVQLRQQIARLAPRSTNVIIVGESGVGKELVALSLHRQSLRTEAPMVPVNCAAISSNLIEAELFGHCRGAFTGADRDRQGYFQQADEGTLFLDEIGELSLECQAKLLRAIELKRFRPVGGENEIKGDVRVIAATHRDLESLVRHGRFRQDLFYRLGIPLSVVPLREHVEDIPSLVNHFLPRLRLEYRRQLKVTPAAIRRLEEYSWPGNVRQLRSVLEHAVAMGDGTTIDLHDLQLPCDNPIPGGLPSLNLEKLEAQAIREALLQTGGNMSQAADILGIHRETLAAKMKRYNIPRKE